MSTARARFPHLFQLNFALASAVVLALLPSLAFGQVDPPPPYVVPGTALQGVHVDDAGGGEVWVLAPGYKARFGRDGVDYFPYFGAKADRLYPVHFRLASARIGEVEVSTTLAAAPRVDGDRIHYDHGKVTETWHLRKNEVEQTFVVRSDIRSGDLVLRLSVATELRASDVADGLSFAHDSLGSVHYGDVTAFDADGRRVHAPARLCADGIELRLSQAAIAPLSGAITVDPIVRAISVDTGADVVGDSDVAFEPNTRFWLVVYSRTFATTDTDIISRRFHFDGNLVEEVVVATGSRESSHPSVGASAAARQFLIAWDEDTVVADRVILGRRRVAASASQSNTFTVLDTAGFGIDDIEPRVGGSMATDSTGSVYGVVCTSDSSAGRLISFVRVTTSGAAARVATLSGTGQNVTFARINKARANGEPWMCLYLERHGSSSFNLHAATAPATGSSVQRGVVDASFGCGLGAVAGRGSSFLAVYSQEVAAGNSDLFARRLSPTVSGLVVGSRFALTAKEPGAVPAVNQVDPTLAFDGHRYTYAYSESTGSGGTSDIYAAVVSVPTFTFSDGHRAVHASSAERESVPEIAACGEIGGEVARSFISFTRQQLSGNPDIGGTFFDGTANLGGVTALPSRCGGHLLEAENGASLGAVLRLRASLTAPTSQVFLVGVRSPLLTLCAAGCKLGVSPAFIITPGASLDLPIPNDLKLIGAEFAVQNLLFNANGGCAPPEMPFRFLTSTTLVFVVR